MRPARMRVALLRVGVGVASRCAAARDANMGRGRIAGVAGGSEMINHKTSRPRSPSLTHASHRHRSAPPRPNTHAAYPLKAYRYAYTRGAIFLRAEYVCKFGAASFCALSAPQRKPGRRYCKRARRH